jgi:hypothetical protein
MASAIPSLLVAYEGDTGLMGFTSTSQGFFMLGSGPNLNNVSAGWSETDAQTPFPAGTISNLWCRVKTAAATANSTVVLRKNGANGNENANTTGAFSDATDTDSIVIIGYGNGLSLIIGYGKYYYCSLSPLYLLTNR